MQPPITEAQPRRLQQFSMLRSVGSRLFLSVLGGSLVGLAVTSYLSYQALSQKARGELLSRLQVKAENLEGKLQAFETSTQLVANTIATLQLAGEKREGVYVDLLRRSLTNTPLATGLSFGQPPDQRRVIPDLRYAYPTAVRGVDGTVTAKGGESNPEYYTANYFVEPIAAGKGIWLEPVSFTETTFNPPRILVTTSFSMPIYDDNKQLLGVLGQDMELGFLSETLSEKVIDDSGHFLLVSAKGNLIAYPPDPQQAVELKPFPNLNNYQQLWQVVQGRLKSPSAKVGIINWQDNTGKRELWAYRHVANTEWVLLAAVPQSVVLDPVIRLTLWGAIGAAGGASLVLAIVVALFVKSLNQRLQPIMDECNRLAETNAKSEELMAREDELGRLTISFYNLLGQVTVNERRLRQEMQRSAQAFQALKQTQSQLIQTEKMSGLGQLVAGVAHEINNPINFIYGNLPHASSYIHDLLKLIYLYQKKYPQPDAEIQSLIEDIDLDFVVEDLEKMLVSMRSGADRIREIVLSLRNFSRLDEAEMKPVNIHEGIDSTLLILHNRLRPTPGHPEIKVIREYGDLPKVNCYAGQLNQVFMNILSNALDELGRAGDSEAEPVNSDTTTAIFAPIADPKIIIHTEVSSDQQMAIIRFKDNGRGISAENQSKLFDPFFTTKPVGKGTGLGLSISYQIIVEKHHGTLKCISAPGEGAEFQIAIPINPPNAPS